MADQPYCSRTALARQTPAASSYDHCCPVTEVPIVSRLILLYGLVLCLLASVVSNAAAQRQGLIVGFGVGLGVTKGDVDTKLGAAADLRIGTMVSESVQLYLTSKSNFFSEDGGLVAAALHGLGATHEWDSGFSINGTAGVGTWIDFDWDTYVGYGLGLGLGVGY